MPRRPDDKKRSILRHAEELFANYGLHGVSIRDIAQAATCPPALVLYHFKTKEDLYQAVFESRSDALSAMREKALRPLLERPERPNVREVLHALAHPWLELRNVPGGVSYARLVAREVSDPSEAARGIIAKTLDPMAKRFLEALIRAAPDLKPKVVHWAYHYFVAAQLLMMANTGRIQRLSGANCRLGASNVDEIVEFFGGALECMTAGERTPRRRIQTARVGSIVRRRTKQAGTNPTQSAAGGRAKRSRK